MIQEVNDMVFVLNETIDLAPDRLKDMLFKMHLTRIFEDAAFQQYSLGKVHGTMHLCSGQEAVAVGAIAALQPDDLITSTHRGHGHAIAKGQDINTMMAELLAKETGVCRGRGGSMHMADLNVGSLGANGVVSGGIPLAVGAGLSIHLRGSDQVCMCFFGDGASNEGAFHESINMAAVWKLPVVFLCENNQYGMSMSLARANSSTDIADRAIGYGIPGETVDGMDPLAVYEAARPRGAARPVWPGSGADQRADLSLFRPLQERQAALPDEAGSRGVASQGSDPGLRQPADRYRHHQRGRSGCAGSAGSQGCRGRHRLGRRRPGARRWST